MKRAIRLPHQFDDSLTNKSIMSFDSVLLCKRNVMWVQFWLLDHTMKIVNVSHFEISGDFREKPENSQRQYTYGIVQNIFMYFECMANRCYSNHVLHITKNRCCLRGINGIVDLFVLKRRTLNIFSVCCPITHPSTKSKSKCSQSKSISCLSHANVKRVYLFDAFGDFYYSSDYSYLFTIHTLEKKNILINQHIFIQFLTFLFIDLLRSNIEREEKQKKTAQYELY